MNINGALSLIIPAYNEEESLRPLYEAIKPVLENLRLSYEIIFVDDGSSDGTFEILHALHEKDKDRVRVIRFRRNFGQTPAMAAGIDYSRGDVVITLDADLQNDPADIPRLLKKMNEGYDIVSGWRKDRKDKAVSRKLPSMIANRMIGVMTGVHIHDYGCTLKAYRGDVIRQMHLYSDMHRFMAALGALAGARVTEIPVTHHARKFGVSKYGISRTFKVLVDVLSIKLILGFSSRPMHLFGIIALPAALLGMGCAAVSLNIYLHNPPVNLTSVVIPTVTLLWLFLAVYLIGLGILAELILKSRTLRIRACAFSAR